MNDWELIIKYLKNEASPKERVDLENWLKKSKENVLIFERAKHAWDSFGVLEQDLVIDKSQAWDSIRTKLALASEINTVPSEEKKRYLSWWAGIAATIALTVFGSYVFVEGVAAEETVTAVNEIKLVVLSDSTSVILNKNSSLIYPREFKQDVRQIRLKGEAFFKVKKNARKPFLIANENFEVRVLGTSFNISAYEKDTKAIITVVTGKVAVKANDGGELTLIADEQGVFNKADGQLEKQKNADLNFLSWKTKKIEFKDAPLNLVCDELKDYFGVTIDVKNKELFKCRFTGTFQDPTLEHVLSILEKTLNIRAVANNKQVVITGPGC